MNARALPFALAGLLAFAVPAFAANRDGEVVSFGADCGASGCRAGGTTLDIVGRDGHTYSIPVAHSPYVMADGTIVIFPGEKLVFEIPAGDKPGVPRLLADGADAAPGATTVSLDYQDANAMMTLNIRNGSTGLLKLDAYFGLPDGDNWKLHYTSSCAVPPHIFDLENWPAPLGPIFIGNIHYLPTSGSMSCN